MFHVEHSKKNRKEMKQDERYLLHPLMWVVVCLVIFSAGMFAVALMIPPEGEVHSSALKGLSIMTINIALVIFAYSVVSGKTATFEHGNTRAVIGGGDDGG